jgi:hypothetical protein
MCSTDLLAAYYRTYAWLVVWQGVVTRRLQAMGVLQCLCFPSAATNAGLFRSML